MTNWADPDAWFNQWDDDDGYAELIAEQRTAHEAEEVRIAARDAELLGFQILADGRVIYVNDDRTAEWLTCSWLVRVASGNPEPSCESDCYKDVDCGSQVTAIVRAGKPLSTEHTTCGNGHDRHAYGSAEWQAEDMEYSFRYTNNR